MSGEPGVSVELIRGANGVFDVLVGEDLVFSKHSQGRFPETGEVVAILRAGAAGRAVSPRGE